MSEKHQRSAKLIDRRLYKYLTTDKSLCEYIYYRPTIDQFGRSLMLFGHVSFSIPVETINYIEYLVNLRTPSHGRDCTSQMQAPNYTNLFLHNARYLSLYTVKVLLLTKQQERHSEQECRSLPDHHHTDVDLKFRKIS